VYFLFYQEGGAFWIFACDKAKADVSGDML
jgi:hypothetical protein